MPLWYYYRRKKTPLLTSNRKLDNLISIDLSFANLQSGDLGVGRNICSIGPVQSPTPNKLFANIIKGTRSTVRGCLRPECCFYNPARRHLYTKLENLTTIPTPLQVFSNETNIFILDGMLFDFFTIYLIFYTTFRIVMPINALSLCFMYVQKMYANKSIYMIIKYTSNEINIYIHAYFIVLENIV